MDITALVTAATFATQVTIADAGNDTLVTINDLGGTAIGTITLVNVLNPAAVTVDDFLMA